ncbi:MAG TPA: threonine/serine dehydratase [Gemmatimonadaceae bacterium]
MFDVSAVRAARERISGRVHTTPLLSASRLGRRVGVQLFLKCENLQKTGSFKARGALNKVSRLDASSRDRGVVTFSAGNHAQSLAWAAAAAGVRAVVVMPTGASVAKVEASRSYGAEVVLHGANGMEALSHARELEREHGLAFVHPFDDELVAAGQGTTALELLEQVDDLDVIVVPIGGGGLIAGMLVAVKAINPKIRVYGVEPTGAASMRVSLDSGRAEQLDVVNTIADGLAAPMAGELTFAVVQRYVDDVVLVTDGAIADAVRELLLSAKLLAEPAGATATAAVLTKAIPLRDGDRVAAVVSGGNVDIAKLTKTIA